MATKIIKEWEITISLTRTLTFPVEKDEDEETFRTWLRTNEGYGSIKDEFLKGMRLVWPGKNTTVEIDHIQLKLPG